MSGSLKVGGSELINDNGGSGSLQWGSGVPAGSVLQVVYADRTGKANKHIQSSSYESADLNTGTITQKQSGSKILVIASVTQAPTSYETSFNRMGYFTFNTSSSGNYSGTLAQKLGKAAGIIADIDNHLYPYTTGKWYINTPSSSFTIYLTAYAEVNTNFYIGGGNYHTSLTVYEIAQ
tara:strand:+ start:799 stop:1332 length:534 start_codon:yes stop_codon:yes gene_type:complete